MLGPGGVPVSGVPDAHDAKHDEDKCNEDTASCELAAIYELARDCNVYVTCEVDKFTGQDSAQRAELSLPSDTKAVLVLLNPGSIQSVCCFKGQLDSWRGSMPIFAAVLGGRRMLEDVAGVVEAHRELHAKGFDDVIIQLEGKAEMKLALSMALVRDEIRRASLVERDAALLAEKAAVIAERDAALAERDVAAAARARELEDLKERLADALAEPKDALFWQVAHKVLHSFPLLREDLPAEAESGGFVERWRLDRLLGRGGFGEVFAATQDGQWGAIKVINKDQLDELSDVVQLWREIKALRMFDHPNIVALHAALHGPRHVFLCMELAGTIDLRKGMRMAGGTLDIGVSQSFGAQLASAIEHCYARGVVHRDLKPENVVIKGCRSEVTVVDWGSATQLDQPCTDMAGTMPFMAPEVLVAEDSLPYDASRVDVWALGVMLLEMLCGVDKLSKMMRWGTTPEPVKRRCAELELLFRDEGVLARALERHLGERQVPEDLVALLRGMLRVTFEERVTPTQVIESAWLQDCL